MSKEIYLKDLDEFKTRNIEALRKMLPIWICLKEVKEYDGSKYDSFITLLITSVDDKGFKCDGAFDGDDACKTIRRDGHFIPLNYSFEDVENAPENTQFIFAHEASNKQKQFLSKWYGYTYEVCDFVCGYHAFKLINAKMTAWAIQDGECDEGVWDFDPYGN